MANDKESGNLTGRTPMLRPNWVVIRFAAALVTCVLSLLPLRAFAQKHDRSGAVCLRSYAPKVMAPDELRRIHLTVDSSEKIFFDHLPRIVLRGLDLTRKHEIRFFYDGKVVQSW